VRRTEIAFRDINTDGHIQVLKRGRHVVHIASSNRRIGTLRGTYTASYICDTPRYRCSCVEIPPSLLLILSLYGTASLAPSQHFLSLSLCTLCGVTISAFFEHLDVGYGHGAYEQTCGYDFWSPRIRTA
jgi:hypothetical protein